MRLLGGPKAAHTLRVAVPSAMLAFIPLAAAAEELVDPYALSPEQLFGATIVSASRSPQTLWDAPAAVFVITNDDITRSGATSIPELLRLAPGVQVARVNTSGWAISVRGFGSSLANKLLVLIDGREVYDPLFSGVYWDVQDTAIEDIERIEIVRGPGASLWGANAVNGVINIITKRASDSQGWLASAAVGNVSRAVLTARYGGQTENAAWRVYGRYTDRASYDTLAGADSNGDWRSWRGGFRVDMERGPRDNFTLQGDVYRSDSGQLRSVPLVNAPYATLEREDISAHGANLLGRWTHEREDGARITTQAYLDFTAREQLTLTDERLTFDIDAQYEFPDMERHDVVAGVRYRRTTGDFEPTAIVTVTDAHNEQDLVSAFVQDRITLFPERWYLTLGSKFDQNDFTGFEFQPNVRLQWVDGETQTAWVSVARAVRTPSELERELTVLAGVIPPAVPFPPAPIAIELRPSPGFASEELTAYEIGYRRQWTNTIATDLAAFHNEYQGLATLRLLAAEIGTPPTFFILPVMYTNETEAVANGFEAVINWRPSDRFELWAAYSFLDLELHGPPASAAIGSEDAENFTPRNLLNVNARWNIDRRTTMDVIAYYTDALPAYRIAPSIRLDLRVGWRLTDTVQFEIVGQGLFDESRREFGDPAGPGTVEIDRSVFAKLAWRS